jgi:hypothetical protein
MLAREVLHHLSRLQPLISLLKSFSSLRESFVNILLLKISMQHSILRDILIYREVPTE